MFIEDNQVQDEELDDAEDRGDRSLYGKSEEARMLTLTQL